MIISSLITIGQITFVLRAAIQILTHVGLALISLIILASVSRVAPIDTHDTINRIIGSSTATKGTARWIFDHIRRKHADPTPSSNLPLILLLSVLYTVFVSLSDIGFLGFYACQVPISNTVDAPASVSSNDAARSLVAANMVTGADPAQVKAYRCESTTIVQFDTDIFENICSNWHNSTWADATFFSALNSTDSDLMMPRMLSHSPQASTATLDLNNFYDGPKTQRVINSTIERGLAVIPHESGVRMISGVPQLAANTKVDIRTMAVEVDVGCMTLGVKDISVLGGSTDFMFLSTNGTWRKYTGPDYMEDVLSAAVDSVREYLTPFFNASTLDSTGQMQGINSSNLILSAAANAGSYSLPSLNFDLGPIKSLMGNCTEAMEKKLGISYDSKTLELGEMCGLLGLGGTVSANGTSFLAYNRMVCATATQVNMVDASVGVDADNQLSANLTRIPSDLNYLYADYFSTSFSNFSNATVFTNFIPYERYTLSDNPKSPTTHFIHQRSAQLTDTSIGPGSGGNIISTVGAIMLAEGFDDIDQYGALGLLDEGLEKAVFTTDRLAKWVGEIGGSVFLGSLGYNGWAALSHGSIPVISTGGDVGSCYKPLYALGFVPLVFSAFVLFLWMIMNMMSGAWFGAKVLEDAYSGITPYTTVACPDAPPKETLLAWESYPEPYLQVIHKGYPVTGDPSATAQSYLKSTLSSSYK